MRKPILLFCFLAISLSGCAPQDRTLRAREERSHADPTMGTENSESQWYRTQTIAAPSAPTAAAPVTTPMKNARARVPKKLVPSTPSAAN